MSLSDCPKCWDTPCECGWEWLGWNPTQLDKFIKMLQRVKSIEEQFPGLSKVDLYKKLQGRLGE